MNGPRAADPRAAALRALLASHRAAGPREEGYRRAMLRLLETTERPFHREQYRPGHFTASAVVLSPDRTRVLLVLHEALGRWLQPGGHVEDGDLDLRASALRELEEETGLAAEDLAVAEAPPLHLDVHPIPPRGAAPGHLHFDVRFLAVARRTALPRAGDGGRLRWAPARQFASGAGDASLLEALARLA